jgi:site-specific DNA-cytosine methylase
MEKYVLDVLGIDVQDFVACDTKPAARRFMLANTSGLTHVFGPLTDLVQGEGRCAVHGETCSVSRERPDLAVLGPPCQPFTKLRQKKGTSTRTGTVTGHPLFDVTMRQTIQYVERYKPRICVVEQVPAFGEMDSRGDTPLETFVAEFSRHFGAVRVVDLDESLWVCASRPRTGILASQPCLPQLAV